MPRSKSKPAASDASKKMEICSPTTSNENKDKLNEPYNSEAISIKTESPDLLEEELSPSKIDLSQFKFEKKTHIKIEYEKDSPVKEEGKGLWEPANWKAFLVNLRIMRSNNDAPVDTMGCHMSMDRQASPETYRYQCLISLMLSSQTKDQVTFAAMERLRARGLTVDNVLSLSDDELGKLIYPVGFWKTKVQYIKKTTQTLKEQYKGDIPDSVDKLCKLRGVGPKMAHICMLVAWDKVTGIGVDTHVHRISNRIGWVKKPTSTPEDTRKALETWLPFELWKEVNHLLVGFGQTICLPIGPMCHECLNRDICPSSGKGRKSPMKNVKQEVKTKMLDDNSEEKPNKNRKVSPRKELNEDIKHQESEIREVKVNNEKSDIKVDNDSNNSPQSEITPKTDLIKGDIQDTECLSIADENESTKLPGRSKVTPKKNVKPKMEHGDMDDFETKNVNLNMQTKTRKKITPNKKLRTNNVNTNMVIDTQNDDQGKTTRNTKGSKKNKVSESSDDDNDFIETNVNSKTNKMKTATKSHLNAKEKNVTHNNGQCKKSPAQKRPLRNKVINQPEGNADTNIVEQKRPRGAEKITKQV